MTQIFYAYINKDNHEFLLKSFLSSFSKEYQDKIFRYKRWEDAQLTLLGRLLLITGLAKNDITFTEGNIIYSKYNKPSLNNSNIKFNISHSGNIAICAINKNNEIGIDIEKIQDININDFRFQMLDSEWNRIENSQDKRLAFFEYWTMKESVIKANGMGLSIPLKSFVIENNHTYIKSNFYLKEIKVDDDYKSYLAFQNKLDSKIQKPERIEIDHLKEKLITAKLVDND